MNRAQQERSTSAEINTRRIRREGLGKASQSKNARTQKKVTCACLDSPFIIMIEARNPLIQTYVFRFSTRSEEHTSELQSLMRISYAVFCLKKKKNTSFTSFTST